MFDHACFLFFLLHIDYMCLKSYKCEITHTIIMIIYYKTTPISLIIIELGYLFYVFLKINKYEIYSL